MDRDALGSWLSGPGLSSSSDPDTPVRYAGERLGLPETGPTAVAGWAQRIAAIAIDWFVALGVTMAFLGSPEPGDQGFSVVVLLVFSLMYVILLLTAQRTIGMAALGVRVLPVGSARVPVWGVVVRTILLALVVPAVVYDRDRRGLHDKAGRTVVVRSR